MGHLARLIRIYRNCCTKASPPLKHDLIEFPELIKNLRESMGVETGYTVTPPDRSHLKKYTPEAQEQLPKRQMKDSFIAARIPLSTDGNMQDKYITTLGNVRVGRLLEDMDIFAVAVAEKHILIPDKPPDTPNPYTLVTASLDRIDFTDYIPKPTIDIKISGHVCYVGKSSMEIVVWLEQAIDGIYQRITRALFTFVARDPTNTQSIPINAIDPMDDEREKTILSGGQLRHKQRLDLSKQDTSKMLPNHDELQTLHDLYLTTKDKFERSLMEIKLPENCVWMENCRLSNTIITHPQHRNLHNSVFGGYIMRKTFELSFMCAYLFGKHRPKIKTMSDIVFRQSISVNSLLQMFAYIVYTNEKFIQITVHVEVIDPITGQLSTTNIVNFTFQAPEVVKQVVPRTYQETMMFIEGRRKFLKTMETSGGDDGGKNECKKKNVRNRCGKGSK